MGDGALGAGSVPPPRSMIGADSTADLQSRPRVVKGGSIPIRYDAIHSVVLSASGRSTTPTTEWHGKRKREADPWMQLRELINTYGFV
jgi:hypothetical protein